jgi:hypothetical protein
MANPDRPRGFTPIKMLSGAPWAGNVRSIGVTSGTDIFIGDLITLTSGLGAVSATNDTAFLGVAVGFGKRDPASGQFAGAYNPDNLETLYYDDSASVAVDWRVFYVPVDDMIFEAQSNADLDVLIGAPIDLVATAGSVTTGRSLQEVGANTNTDMRVVEIPAYSDNDSTLANTRYWITITKAEMAFQ